MPQSVPGTHNHCLGSSVVFKLWLESPSQEAAISRGNLRVAPDHDKQHRLAGSTHARIYQLVRVRDAMLVWMSLTVFQLNIYRLREGPDEMSHLSLA